MTDIRKKMELMPEDIDKKELEAHGNVRACVHLFNESQINAVNAAIACQRPLLLLGEPGTGKSQLARAVAAVNSAAFVPFVVDSHTEARDLKWHFDAVARLADAQLERALDDQQAQKLRENLAVENYLHPGPLWWAFDWDSALSQAKKTSERVFGKEKAVDHALIPEKIDGGSSDNGCVVLIDEIDKAELDVPNGLLEALGDGCFLPEGHRERVRVKGTAPLVMITSNNDRIMPDAFLRRCIVLRLFLPEEKDDVIDFLVERGKAHFKALPEDLLRKAAKMVADDRMDAIEEHCRPLPGQAEYIDLLHAVHDRGKDDQARMNLLEVVRPFVVTKMLQQSLKPTA